MKSWYENKWSRCGTLLYFCFHGYRSSYPVGYESKQFNNDPAPNITLFYVNDTHVDNDIVPLGAAVYLKIQMTEDLRKCCSATFLYKSNECIKIEITKKTSNRCSKHVFLGGGQRWGGRSR